MLDESLLDAPEELARADVHGLLRGAAEAGARVRAGLRLAMEAGLTRLQPDGRPRGVLVAGPGPTTACVSETLAALSNGSVPVTLLRPTGRLSAPGALRWTLPGWAGPLDLVLLVTHDGAEPGLAALVDQAYRRGCTVVAVTPGTAPLADAIGETRGLAVPLAPGPYERYETPEAPEPPAPTAVPVAPLTASETAGEAPGPPIPAGQPPVAPGTLWALLTPLLLLLDRLGLVQADAPALESLADRLDEVAERCGPAIAPYSNPGKTLAAELAGALPLLWSEGPVADVAARHWAAAFAALPGKPALTAGLPEAMTAHGALLAGGFAAASDPDDFFRDRVEEPEALHARVVLLREAAPAGDSAMVAARDMAYANDTPLSELEPSEGSSPLEAAAELIATADFAAVYLTLADSDSPWA
ncbi:SIS domain-containing protein [Streptomyces albiaxialis]|uniref:SIS domain-containing protein n=1 Tax=Streptomyces albiaxialis TaxID=329523 RepID=A0ABN2VD71_9ACTN